MDDMRDIGLFVAVAENRSFTKAASRLGVPTSTMSRRIAELEASLGAKLLSRNTRIVELTEAGRIYFGRCQALVEEARSAREQIQARLGRPQGTLRISVETEIGPRLVGPVIAGYVRKYPEVAVELDVSPRRVDLIAEGFDVAVRIGRLPDSNLIVRRLALLRAHLFAAPSYLQEHGTPADPNELARHRRIHLVHKEDDGSWRLTSNGRAIEVPNRAAVATNSMQMARMFALEGLGIAVIDEFLAIGDVQSGTLVRLLLEWEFHKYPISILTANRLLPMKSRLFIDMLIDQIASTPGLVQA